MIQTQTSEVERVVPNALYDSAIRKRLEDKSLHPRYRAKAFIGRVYASRCAACSGSRNDNFTLHGPALTETALIVFWDFFVICRFGVWDLR